jgi:WD40 repeat protein
VLLALTLFLNLWVGSTASQTSFTPPKIISLPQGAVSLSYIPSPDGKWTLVFECPNNCSRRTLWIEERGKRSRELIKEYDRSLDVSWSPDSRLFFVNDNSGSTDARCYVYEPVSLKQAELAKLKETDVAKLVLAADSNAEQFLKAGHSYLKAKQWLNTHELLVTVTGHDDESHRGFTLQYRVDLRGKVLKLSQRSEE